jgi:Rho-binding antiterminator
MNSTYVPIDCEFHDVLEATATTGRRVAIEYLDTSGQQQTVRARITDLQAHNGEEHMLLDDGSRIRLDAIVSVDGVRLQSDRIRSE